MNPFHPLFRRVFRFEFGPARVAFAYALFGTLWILFSDSLATRIFTVGTTLPLVQTVKGLFYVVLTTGLVYGLVRYSTRRIREERSHYREMAENMQDVFYNYDPVNDRLLFAGRGYEHIWGLPMERVLTDPMSFLDSVHPDDREEILAAHGRSLAGDSTETEFRVIRPDGSVSWVVDYSSSIVNAEGVVDRIVGTMRDITDRKQAQDALAESRRQLSALMDNLPGAAYRCRLDTEWTTLFLSEGITPLTGYRPADFMHNGKLTYADLIHPDDRDRVYRDIAAAAARGDTFEIEYRLHTREHAEKTVWERGRFFAYAAGERTKGEEYVGPEGHLEGFILDITDRKQAEADRRRSEERLRQMQKLEAIGQLAGGVAHDFNNMLTIILVRAEMALRKVSPSDPTHGSLREILDAAERSASLTRQLLTYARRQSVAPRPLSLNKFVEEALPMLNRIAGENISVSWHPGEGLWLVELDPSQIDQVLVNLCLNARDALPGGGVIRLETRNMTLTAKDCRVRPELAPGDHVLLSVSDTGSGMDEAVMARVFEPFFTTKEVGKGTGLGLPTVHGIMRQNHGTIEVDSAPGRGSTFRIYLPRHMATSGNIPEDEADGHETLNALPPGQGETVLIAEDDPDVRRLAVEILSGLGYAVLDAANGAAALRIAREHRGDIHLLMTDVDMPGMNGHELAENFGQARPHAGRLFMSGDVVVPAGDAHIVRKPFATAELAIKVRAALAARDQGA